MRFIHRAGLATPALCDAKYQRNDKPLFENTSWIFSEQDLAHCSFTSLSSHMRQHTPYSETSSVERFLTQGLRLFAANQSLTWTSLLFKRLCLFQN